MLLTCTALVSLGCSRAPATDAGSVVPDRDSVIRTEDDGPVVSIPSGSVSGPGQVRVEPVTAVDGARGWSIELDGAQLVGRATIRFPLSGLEPDEPAPLVTYSETIDGQRILAPDVVRDGDDLVVTTGHFSFWWTEKLSTVRDATTQWLRQKYDGLAGAGNGTQPDCPGEQSVDSLDTTGYRVVVTKPVRDTEVVAVSAVDSSGEPLPGWTPQNPARTVIDCRYPYPAASSTSIDIVQCGSTVDGAHTCWIADDRRSLTCAIDVWDEKFLQYRVASPLASVPAATDPQPEWIELDDGTRCSMRHGGAWGGRADGLVGMYSCSGTSSVVLTGRDGPGIDRSTPKWTVEVGELGDPDEQFPPPTTQGVVRAYFAASGGS